MNEDEFYYYSLKKNKRIMYVTEYNIYSPKNNRMGYLDLFHNIFWLSNYRKSKNTKVKYIVIDNVSKKMATGLCVIFRDIKMLKSLEEEYNIEIKIKDEPYIMSKIESLNTFLSYDTSNFISEYEANSPEEIIEINSILDFRFLPKNLWKYKRLFCKQDINPVLIKEFEKDIFQLFNNERILGCVARGTDYNKAKGHRIQCDINKLMDRIEAMMKYDNYDKIFLATESQDILEQFLDKFGNNVLFFPQERFYEKDFQSDNIKAIADLNKHKTKIELEAFNKQYLKIVYGLSICTSLVASGGCGAVDIAKALRETDYEDIYVYNFGRRP